MATIYFSIGDDVYDGVSGSSGIITAMYPEVNTAVIKTNEGVIKAKLTDLYKVVYAEDEVAVKKRTLLDRIKSLFIEESYD